ncbi:MAG: hypothetical protein ACRD26_18415 [Vicinamibacterales bacterium]
MSLVRLAAACACVLTCVSPAGADDAPQNTKPFTRYKVLLDGILNDTLPFDVHFIIWGDVAQTAERVRLRIATVASPADCTTGAATDFKEQEAPARQWVATDYTDRGLTPPTGDPALQPKQFEMVIEPLAPSRFYCFLFQIEPGRPLTPAEQVMLGNRLLPAYREFLRQLGPREDVDERDMEGLRQALIRALLAASGFQSFVPDEGSVFDPRATFQSVQGEFGRLAAEVLNFHNRVIRLTEQLDALGSEQQRGLQQDVAEFARWAASAELKRIAAAAEVSAEERTLLESFARMTSAMRANLLLGRPPETTVVPTLDLWEPDPGLSPPGETGYLATDACPTEGQLVARCAALDAMLQGLARVREIVTRAGGADAAALVPQIEQTIRDAGRRKIQLLTLQKAINDREEVITKHVALVNGQIAEEIKALVTTIGNLATRRTWYLSMDTGLAVAPRIEEVFPYVGANIYFRPVNREAGLGHFLTRFSAVVGFTWTANLEQRGVRQALFGENAMLVLGAGLRFHNLLRLNGGALVLKGFNPNPLIATTRLEVTPFISMSGDLDLAGLLGGLFGAGAKPPTLGAGAPPK